MNYAVILTATGELRRFAGWDLTSTLRPGEEQVLINETTEPPEGVPWEAVKVNGSSDFEEMTEAEKLPYYKRLRMAEVDAKTTELISDGFEFPAASGKIFSLSMESQVTVHGSYTARSVLSYPIHWMTRDDDNSVDLADATDVENFFAAAVSVVRAHRDSGSTLKDSIIAAVDKAALDAIVDGR